MKYADLLATARRVLWQTWMNSEDEIASAGAQGLLDAGMLVEPGAASELERLRLLLDAQPVELSEEQLGALIAAGNGALSDYYHERQCACSEYPAGCATNPAYRREFGYWDTDAFALGMGAVLGVWESIRTDASAVEIERLRARVAELEGPDEEERFQPHPVTGSAPVRPIGLTADELATIPPGTYGCTCGHGDNVHGPFCFVEDCTCGRFEHKRPSEDPPPRPRGASEIKHPTMRRTRAHFTENPLPEQKRKDGAA
ncbi:hypothetical protein [Streptomyces sp. NPDC013171]|uniref:hypothetical protein n=1 Tax=Streptomyces sp. NPDC013171 TaxID=3364863 RepID=UPI0036A3F6FD